MCYVTIATTVAPGGIILLGKGLSCGGERILVRNVHVIHVRIRAEKSKSLIRWKRLKGCKRRKKAEKADLI